jgi:hypothetical protein
MQEIVNYLNEQRKLCIEQTGTEPHMIDYGGYLASPEFIEKFGEVNLIFILNWLVEKGA